MSMSSVTELKMTTVQQTEQKQQSPKQHPGHAKKLSIEIPKNTQPNISTPSPLNHRVKSLNAEDPSSKTG